MGNPTAASEIKGVLAAIKSAIEGNETVAAYTGWGGVLILDPSIHTLQWFEKCGVVLIPDDTEEVGGQEGDGPVCSGLVRYGMHRVGVYVGWRLDEMTADGAITSTGGLLDLTKEVRNVLRDSTLSSAVEWCDTVHTSYYLAPPTADGVVDVLFNKIDVTVKTVDW